MGLQYSTAMARHIFYNIDDLDENANVPLHFVERASLFTFYKSQYHHMLIVYYMLVIPFVTN